MVSLTKGRGLTRVPRFRGCITLSKTSKLSNVRTYRLNHNIVDQLSSNRNLTSHIISQNLKTNIPICSSHIQIFSPTCNLNHSSGSSILEDISISWVTGILLRILDIYSLQ